MYTIDDDLNSYPPERTRRRLWVGNLHPNVSSKSLGEMFCEVGAVECVEFVIAEDNVWLNIASVVFEHKHSVRESIQSFHNIELYGLKIIMKNFSNEMENLNFYEQLFSFKRLVNEIQKLQPDYESRCNDQTSYSNNRVSYSSRSILTFDLHYIYLNENSEKRKSGNISRHYYVPRSSRYQRSNPYNISGRTVDKIDYNSDNESPHGHTNSEYKRCRTSITLYDNYQDSYHNQRYYRNNRDYNDQTSSNQIERTFHKEEFMSISRNNTANYVSSSVDLRNIINQKRGLSDTNLYSVFPSEDLRDTIKNRKSDGLENSEQNYETLTLTHHHWSKSYHMKSACESNFPNKTDQKYCDYNLYRDKSFNGFLQHNNIINWPEKNKNNHKQSQNIESSHFQDNSYYQYERNNKSHKRSNDKPSSFGKGKNYTSRSNGSSWQKF